MALYFSSSVIKPSKYCSSNKLTDFSAFATISDFLGDTLTSFIAIDTPDFDEFLNPRFLILSNTIAAPSFPKLLKHCPVSSRSLFLSTSAFSNGMSSGRTSLNKILPTDVSIQSPFGFLTLINARSDIASTSLAKTASSKLLYVFPVPLALWSIDVM